MSGFVAFVAVYLGVGAMILVVFDLITKRIRKGFRNAAAETSIKMFTGQKTSALVFGAVMWATWPVVLYGAIESWLKNRKKQMAKAKNEK